MKRGFLLAVGAWAALAGLAHAQPAPLPSAEDEEAPRVWFQSEFLLWWVSRAPTPPLVTAGSSADAVPGALGQPGTRVLYGGENVGFGASPGVRLGLGGWIDDERAWGVAASGFFLGVNPRSVSFAPGGPGTAVLAQPVITPGLGESSYVTAFPGALRGDLRVDSQLRDRKSTRLNSSH